MNATNIINQNNKKSFEDPENYAELKQKESVESEVDPVEKFLKKRNFPISLIRQYFPKREEGYTFNLLPLPFLQNLKSCAIREHSLNNEDNYKSWKEFMHKLPGSQNDIGSKPDNRYWRWKNYKKYVPEERIYFRKTMSIGPKLDQLGRLPTPQDEVNKFRICRANTPKPQRYNTFLKKRDGLKNSVQINKKI